MKMRVYGFGWNPEFAPKAVLPAAVFERITEVPGREFGSHLAAVTKLGDWWGGLLLKIRDARKFTRLRKEDGVLVLSAHELENDERLAETNFFVAHESNGHGLYCHHYLSASLLGDFGYYCSSRFAEMVKARKEKRLEEDPKLPTAHRNAFRGRLVLEQILKPGSFDNYVRELRQINTLEANLVTFKLTNRHFAPLAMQAKRKKIILGFDPNAHMGQIASAIVECRHDGLIDKAKVVGKDQSGREQTYRTNNDAALFGEYEYDDVVANLSVRFDDMEGSIRRSDLIARLLETANDPKVKRLLGI